MLDKKKYYKIFGAVLFAAVLLYGASTAHTKNTQIGEPLQKQKTESASSFQGKTLTLSAVLEKTLETSDVKHLIIQEPTIVQYIVKPSDTVESIANTYGIKLSTITASNSITESTVLTEGQKLTFPSVDGVIYTIKGGETLWDLSNLYKLSSDEIIAANNIENPDKLKLGQTLIIPNAEKALALETSKATSTASSSSNTSTTSKSSQKSKTLVALNRGVKPASGSISSNFGERWGKDHNGVDIAASTGTDVHAYNSGTVSFSGWMNGYGNLVIINHGNGLQTYYGHNSKLLVKVGQTVTKGQHISEVGSTGRSTGPHLHFEVRKNGTPIDPMPYLR